MRLRRLEFAEDVRTYDWQSLFFAALAGLVGGAVRWVVTNLDRGSLVGNQKMLLLKDLVVAIMGGAAVFLVLEAYNVIAEWAHLLTVSHGLRVLPIAYAGFSRGRWMGVLDRFASDAIARASAQLRGGAPADPPPVVAPPAGEGAP
jgi:hypothetical protein